ncbi:ladinin-1 [Eucyclogobius newberryi]|uniref:ladinin-1 n=1 Tax=Eucyclogobius newberryi TaxID=166745 RepID=UPI003B5A76D2
MSISRKNWSALSSLAQRWTVEDEEEVERERRRRVRGSSSTADPDHVIGPEHPGQGETGTGHGTPTGDQALSSAEQTQLDFVELLRSRDEKRRLRHVETLRRQKEAVDDDDDDDDVHDDDEAVAAEPLGDLEETQRAAVSLSAVHLSKPAQPTTNLSRRSRSSSSSSSESSCKDIQIENGESSSKDRDPPVTTNPARKFVSSVSISLDKSPSASGRTTPMSPRSPTTPMSPRSPTTPMSPRSPTTPLSPRENWSASRASPSPVQNGHVQQNAVNGSSKFEPTSKPAFVRQSSRTISFRMMKIREEEASPLQRSASVKIASKKFERNTEQSPEEDTASSFQRNSRQRISSRSIQEKMERLAQAAQRSEMVRSPDVSQIQTLSMMEEVSRKRGLFEQPQQQDQSLGASRQEFKNTKPGLSERINKWMNKKNQTGLTHGPSDLRHVDITSKKSLFEKKADDSIPSPGKL